MITDQSKVLPTDYIIQTTVGWSLLKPKGGYGVQWRWKKEKKEKKAESIFVEK